MEATRIQMLAVDSITPHPDNPRKDLGDLTELADSIRSSGILQNLTVVDYIDGISAEKYTCVIGHRRLAAARLAGLTHVPCVVSAMPYKQQLATMLLENLQRSDLTVLEQAQGFQLMMDLGESADSIAKQTGFSRTTVYHRLNLAKLDQGKLADKVQKGATLMDLVQLEQIEDIEARNKLLEEIGGHNFNWSFQQALKIQKADKFREQWKAKLSSFARETKQIDWNTMDHYQHINLTNDPSGYQVPSDAEERVYFYHSLKKGKTDTRIFYERKQSVVHAKPEETAQDQQRREAVHQLQEDSKVAWELRLAFLRQFQPRAQDQVPILSYLLKVIGLHDYRMAYSYKFDPDFVALSHLMGVEITDDLSIDEAASLVNAAYESLTAQSPWLAAAHVAYAGIEDNEKQGAYWHIPYPRAFPVYRENEPLDRLYDWLEGLGYPISDLERDLMSGKHPMMMLEDVDDDEA